MSIPIITEGWFVSSFTIRIDPSKGEDQATNNGVVLTYTAPNGEEKTLKISQTDTAKVHWELPACGGDKPAENAEYGAEKFPQSWENGKLTPASKDWKENLAGGELGACEWRCNDGYHAENGKCVSDTQQGQCTGIIPENATKTD